MRAIVTILGVSAAMTLAACAEAPGGLGGQMPAADETEGGGGDGGDGGSGSVLATGGTGANSAVGVGAVGSATATSSSSTSVSTGTAMDTSTSTSGGGEVVPDDPMQAFGKCMSVNDWIQTGMPMVANQLSTGQGNVACYSCHNNYETGNNPMPDPNLANSLTEIQSAFDHIRFMYSSFNLIRTTTNEDGSFADIVKSYRWRDKGQEGTNHPTYTLEQEYLDSYESWFTLSYARWQAGDCVEDPLDPTTLPARRKMKKKTTTDGDAGGD